MKSPENRMGVEPQMSLARVFDAFGLIKKPNGIKVEDTSEEAIVQKITNPKIAEAMGASPRTIALIGQTELTANLLDSFSETGERQFLLKADETFQRAVGALPEGVRELVLNLSKAAMTYFYFEAAVARRIKNGEQFLNEEAIEYLLRRGADSTIYAAILQTDGITSPGLIAGFRARQALWDLEDDVRDLEQDRLSIGANVLLLSTNGNKRTLRGFADELLQQSRDLLIPHPLGRAIEEQYEKTIAALN